VGCGLCCNGSYLSSGAISESAVTRLAGTKIDTYRGADTYRFRIPCSCHIDGRCSIYADRPDVCANYRCNLLKAVTNGSVEGARARAITDRIKARYLWLKEAAEACGYFTLSEYSLVSVLSEFYTSVLPRAEIAPLRANEITFALHAFEYLTDVDRNLQSTENLSQFANLISAIDRPKTKFTETDTSIRRFSFGPDGQMLEVRNCPEVLEPLGQIIKGWGLQEVDPAVGESLPILRIWRQDDLYYWDTPYPGPHTDFKEPSRDPRDVASDIHYYLDQIFELTTRSYLFVHAAVVELNGQILLFPGERKTGK